MFVCTLCVYGQSVAVQCACFVCTLRVYGQSVGVQCVCCVCVCVYIVCVWAIRIICDDRLKTC